jgi:hypothetical protein
LSFFSPCVAKVWILSDVWQTDEAWGASPAEKRRKERDKLKVLLQTVRFGENSPFGGKMTFLWEFFSDLFEEIGDFLSVSHLVPGGI